MYVNNVIEITFFFINIINKSINMNNINLDNNNINNTRELEYISLNSIKNKAKKLLKRKSLEYTANHTRGRFENFTVQTQFLDDVIKEHYQPYEAIMFGMAKHAASLYMMLEEPQTITKEYLYEKIGDAFNYLILLTRFQHSQGEDIYNLSIINNKLEEVANKLIYIYNQEIEKTKLKDKKI